MRWLALVVSMILLAGILAVNAAEPRWHHNGDTDMIASMQACADDYFRFCASAGTDHSAIHKCFLDHRSGVSTACMVAVRRFRPDLAQRATP